MGIIRIVLSILVMVALYKAWRFLTEKPQPPPLQKPRSPYEVLGIAKNANAEEIRAAYQNLMQKYHPDKVADMADEFKELAEKRCKEINAAYALLKKEG